MTGGSVRRWGARACLFGALVCLPLALLDVVSAQERDDEPVRPDVFRSSASAAVASVIVDRQGPDIA